MRNYASRLDSKTAGLGRWSWVHFPEFKAAIVRTTSNANSTTYHFSDGSRGFVRSGYARFQVSRPRPKPLQTQDQSDKGGMRE